MTSFSANKMSLSMRRSLSAQGSSAATRDVGREHRPLLQLSEISCLFDCRASCRVERHPVRVSSSQITCQKNQDSKLGTETQAHREQRVPNWRGKGSRKRGAVFALQCYPGSSSRRMTPNLVKGHFTGLRKFGTIS